MRIIRIPDARFGHIIYSYRLIDSTQDKAFELARQGADDGVVVETKAQSRGRGRESKFWISENGGLYFSIIYRPQTSVPDSSTLTRIIGSNIKRVMEKLISKFMNIDLKQRGINDLLLNNRKLIGILVETETYASDQQDIKPEFYIIGIGVNIDQSHFPRYYESIATSLKIETSKSFSRFKILKEICNGLGNILPK
jgi:BirA family transcriptional regulator, biotin operon repressor / biotin---[acetyl-CoA-carboxylase] ligase